MNRWIGFLVLAMVSVTAFFLVLPEAFAADLYMKQKVHTDAIQIMGMNQPAKDTVAEIWITENGFRTDDPEHSMIMLTAEQKMIVIDHKEKTYMEQPLNLNEMMAEAVRDEGPEAQAAMREQQAAMGQMMQGMMNMEVTVEETSATKTIGKWKCRKYIVTVASPMMPMTTEVWATEDIQVDPKVYDQMTSRMVAGMPGMQSSMDAMKEKLKKIKGVQVMSVSTANIMGQTQKTTTELLDFKEAKAPANLFAVPAGYRKASR